MNDKKKKLTIVALIIAVIGLTIGFAAFSSTLTINSGASVNPIDNFKVVFSSSNSTLETNPVVATNAYGTSATIDNTNNSNPKISGLDATFTEPGQSVTYNFYVRNEGEYDAYLTNIVFSGDNFKTCKPAGDNPGTDSFIQNACDDISVTIDLGPSNKSSKITVNSNMTTDAIDTILESNHILPKEKTDNHNSEPISVTITYDENGDYTDGSFKVEFKDIFLSYATVAGYKPELPEIVDNTCDTFVEKSFGTCTYTDLDSSGSLTMGDKITCGTEGFYAIANPSEGRVNMLAEYNLNIGGLDEETKSQILEMTGEEWDGRYVCSGDSNNPSAIYQDEHARGYVDEELIQYQKSFTIDMAGGRQTVYLPYGTLAFANEIEEYDGYGYWTNGTWDSLNENFTECSGDYCYNSNSYMYPIEVYGKSNSQNGGTDNLTSYVNSYVNLLNTSVPGVSATGRLITYKELLDLGCSGNNNYMSCSLAPSWVYGTSYWSGSASNSINNSLNVWVVRSSTDLYDYLLSVNFYGLRPVVTISTSAIEAS